MSEDDNSLGAPSLNIVAPGVALVSLERPQVLNALRPSDMIALIDVVERLGMRDDVRSVVLTGSGRAFCAGGDLRALQKLSAKETHHYLAAYADLGDVLSRVRVPVIAALNGLTFGGGLELACMADIRVAEPSTTLCAADIPHGLVPTGGLTWRLPRLIGHGRASWMILSNATVAADEAHRIGLCDLVAADGAAVKASVQLATQIAGFPPSGVAATVHALRLSARATLSESAAFEIDANRRLLRDEGIRQHLDAVLSGQEPSSP